jgi:sarcosine oxidase subunit gamma
VAEVSGLSASFPLGGAAPLAETIGPFRLVERADHSVHALAGDPAQIAGMAAPGPGGLAQSGATLVWWAGPRGWMLASPDAAPHDVPPDTFATDTTDGWLWLEIAAPMPALGALFARLCDVDLPGRAGPFSARTGIEHHAVWLLRPESGRVTILGARSSAASLYRAIAGAARSVTAQGAA